MAGSSLALLAFLGGLAAHVGGAGVRIGAIRVLFWGALAMVITAGVGTLFGGAGLSRIEEGSARATNPPIAISTGGSEVLGERFSEGERPIR